MLFVKDIKLVRMASFSFKWMLLLLSITNEHCANGAKILALMNVASPSHYIFNRALLLGLAERGHQVTVISPDNEKKPVPNYTVIQAENIYSDARDSYDYEEMALWNMWDLTFALYEWGAVLCDKQLNTTGGQTLLNYPSTEKFDLIITEGGWGECFFGFIHKFGYPPVVATFGVGVPHFLSQTLANPENPSYMPNYLLSYTDHMTILERLHNFIMQMFVDLIYRYYNLPLHESVAKKYFKDEMPPFIDIASNYSIVLVNTAFGLDISRPLLPNVIPIGGMHVKTKPDPLPKDIKQFLDEAKDGFIYFSLGTNLKSEALPAVKRKALLDAFAELPQRVLWKFESDNLPGLPPNVKIGKWLPQSGILAHPNIRLFITHCGMMSTMESSYWGVPIVGVPFFFDQKVNMQKFVSKGGGVWLDYTTLTKESILKAIRTITQNESYRKNMMQLSELLRDQPQTALDRAIFWTEYVIRHGGAPHLRSAAADLSWYQYLLLDVISILVAIGILFILIAYLILKIVFRTIFNLFFKTPKKMKTS